MIGRDPVHREPLTICSTGKPLRPTCRTALALEAYAASVAQRTRGRDDRFGWLRATIRRSS